MTKDIKGLKEKMRKEMAVEIAKRWEFLALKISPPAAVPAAMVGVAAVADRGAAATAAGLAVAATTAVAAAACNQR
jgi:hypothetical protein